jgi:hypothetical protein
LGHAANCVDKGSRLSGHAVSDSRLGCQIRNSAAVSCAAYFGKLFLHQGTNTLINLRELEGGLNERQN